MRILTASQVTISNKTSPMVPHLPSTLPPLPSVNLPVLYPTVEKPVLTFTCPFKDVSSTMIRALKISHIGQWGWG